jgi:hypothetical protein
MAGAGTFSDILENGLLNYFFKGTAFTKTVYVGISTSTPNDDGTGVTEHAIGDDSYARVQTSTATWEVSSAGVTANAVAITFPEASGAGWGTVTHFVLYDAATAGNFLGSGSIGSQAVAAGETLQFDAGDLTITLV